MNRILSIMIRLIENPKFSPKKQKELDEQAERARANLRTTGDDGSIPEKFGKAKVCGRCGKINVCEGLLYCAQCSEIFPRNVKRIKDSRFDTLP